MIGAIAVAIGGAIGALARYGVSHAAFKIMGAGFPYGTLCVNVLGSVIMGLLIGVFAHFWQPSPHLKLMIVTGFLGAFTTFSTFSLDVISLYERGEFLSAAAYVAASLVLSVGGLLGALILVRGVVS